MENFSPLDVSVSIDEPSKVKGLSFNAGNHLHQATFAVRARRSNGQPWPSGTTFTWTTPKDNMDFADKTAATTATATGPQLAYPTCTIVVRTDKTYAGYASAECAAIGGPIHTGVSGNGKPTYDHDDNDPAKSWYLTYYDYSHSSTPPVEAEMTHDATMTVNKQPTVVRNNLVKGCSVAWTLPDSTYTRDPITNLTRSGEVDFGVGLTVHVSAEGHFKDQIPQVKFHLDDGVISGDAYDDSAMTEIEVVDPVTQTKTWAPLVYKISAHEPSYLTLAEETSQPFLPPQGTAYWTDKQLYKYILHYTDKAQMPGVYIQERFTDMNPLRLRINGYDTTLGGPNPDPNANSFVWFTLRVSPLNKGVNSADGKFNEYDGFWYYG